MDALVIREASAKDIQEMVLLLEQLFSVEQDFSFDPEIQARGLSMMIDGCGKHRTVQVACVANRVIGMCTAQTRISTAKGAVCAVVEDLVVDRAFQGKGIGPKLLGAIQAWAQNKGVVSLSLLADKNNTNGLTFYGKNAWQPTQLICLVKPL